MASDIDGFKVHGSPTIDVIEIPADIVEALERLPDRNESRKMFLPEWVDEALKQYWRKCRKADVARMLGYSEGVLRRRAEELGI